MKIVLITLSFSVLMLSNLRAQDEGKIVKRERIERDKNIFVGGGISLINDSNLKEYSTGFNFEGGFSKRLNRILSVGASVSYLSFAYNTPTSAKQAPVFGKYPDNFYTGFQNFPTQSLSDIHTGYLVNFNNTNLSFLSLAVDFKVNFVPVKENSVISIYGFAKPFVSYSKHSDITIGLQRFTDLNNTNTWTSDQSASAVVPLDGQVTGGIFIGPGIEINPTKPISFFIQASFGYTLSSDFISTKSYTTRSINYFVAPIIDKDWPGKTTGFSSINFSGGVLINLD
jgi:Outer membrane protein beta-barrel domain